MANLKGSSFQKQTKDAFHRLEAFGVSRHGKDDNLTHSNKLAEKREMYLKDIASYFEAQEIQGKLNQLLTNENLDSFFSNRLESLSSKSTENYLRGFSSMIKGLEAKNIEIPVLTQDKDYFNDKVSQIKDISEVPQIENRYIENVENVISNLYKDRQISGLIAETQYELGIRQAEAFELVKNPSIYIDNGMVSNLIGKGNHQYEIKHLSLELEHKLLNNQESLIDKSTYYRDLNFYGISSHDLRFTFARDKFENLISSGITEKESKLRVSQELNHKRKEITEYYLKRSL